MFLPNVAEVILPIAAVGGFAAWYLPRRKPVVCVNCGHGIGRHRYRYRCSHRSPYRTVDKEGYAEPPKTAICFCDWSRAKVLLNVPKPALPPKRKGVLEALAEEYAQTLPPTMVKREELAAYRAAYPKLPYQWTCKGCGTTCVNHTEHYCVGRYENADYIKGYVAGARAVNRAKYISSPMMLAPVLETVEEKQLTQNR